MKRIALKWMPVCLATGIVATGLALVTGVVSHGSARLPKIARTYSTVCATTDTGFCIAGPASSSGPTLYPGGGAQPLPLTITNYFGSPITLTQITVSFTNTFPAGCDPSAIQIGASPDAGTRLSGSQPSAVLNLPSGFTVGGAIGSTPTTASIDTMLYVSMLDLPSNQDACKNLPLTMTYQATASTNVSCVTQKVNGSLTIHAGEDICVQGGGIQNGNVTIQSGGRLDLLGGTINGGVTVQSGGAVNVQSGNINGSVSATGANLFSICSASINGTVSASSSSAFVLIGDGADDGSPTCAGNAIKGGVTLTANSAGAEIGGNTISGSVTMNGTTGAAYGGNTDYAGKPSTAPEVEKNSMSGGLSCAGNSPSPTDDGLPNSVGSGRSGQCATPSNF